MPRLILSASAVIAGFAFWLTLGFILFCIVLVASADVYEVSGSGVLKATGRLVGPGDWTAVATFAEGDVVIFRGQKPKDPDDPRPGNLESRVKARAAAIGEKQVAETLATSFETFAKAITENNMPWDNAVAGVKRFSDFVLSGSGKRTQWEAALAQTYAEMASEPHTAATFLTVSRGLKAGAGAAMDGPQQINWAKLLECLPCIIQAFITPAATASTEPTPDESLPRTASGDGRELVPAIRSREPLLLRPTTGGAPVSVLKATNATRVEHARRK